MKTKNGSSDHFRSNDNIEMDSDAQLSSKKVLVAYFSHSGNTRIIAEQIKSIIEGEIFEILPVKNYPSAYKAVVDQAEKEINANYKPQLKSEVENIETYDVFFIGSPNWWSTIAPPVSTFLSSYDFKGKTIIPFITHEGSRMGRSVSDIKKLCPTASVAEGHPFQGDSVPHAQNEVYKWIHTIKIKN